MNLVTRATKFVEKRMRSYLNNNNLKAEGVQIQFTPEQIQEYVRCSEDPIYFILNYVKIVNVDRGLIDLDLYPFQKEMIQMFKDNRFVITKCSRQIGKSTCTVMYILWKILFKSDQSVAILANKASTAQEILSRLKLAYEHLPKWLQQGVREWNKRSIELENNSKVLAAATGSSAARGGSYTTILLDEFAFVPKNIAEDFFTSVYPTISSGKTTQVFIVSTPKGMNLFWKMWYDALEGRSDFKTFEAFWYNVPWKDDKWKEQEIRNLGSLEAFEQEHGGSFLSVSNTLISTVHLQNLKFIAPLEEQEKLKVYQRPIDEHQYVIIADVSEGLKKDSSAFSVIDISVTPYRQVATFKDNEISPLSYPSRLAKVGYYYNEAYILVETNGVGNQVVDLLYLQEEYMNVIHTSTEAHKQKVSLGFKKKKSKRGVKTTKNTKNIGCATLKVLVEKGALHIEDCETIEELTRFVPTRGSYAAEAGCTDDLVMGLVLFGWLTTQDFIKNISNKNLQEILELEQEKEKVFVPILQTKETPTGENQIIDKKNNLIWNKVSLPWNMFSKN